MKDAFVNTEVSFKSNETVTMVANQDQELLLDEELTENDTWRDDLNNPAFVPESNTKDESEAEPVKEATKQPSQPLLNRKANLLVFWSCLQPLLNHCLILFCLSIR